jgi:hypothetical protein
MDPIDREEVAGESTTEVALLCLWRLAKAKEHLLDVPALQLEWRKHRHDENRLGLEVLLQLLCATVRDMASPTGSLRRQQREETSVLAPETQVVPTINLMGGFGWTERKYVAGANAQE